MTMHHAALVAVTEVPTMRETAPPGALDTIHDSATTAATETASMPDTAVTAATEVASMPETLAAIASQTKPPKRDADYVFYELTRSICPDCRRVIDAKVVLRDNKVYMLKRCPDCGPFEALVYGDAEMYVSQAK